MTLQGLVSQAYPSPEFAVFFEVSNATGAGVRRRADAIALGVWPSRGHQIVGFEFKADRRDWLREKANPEKADVIITHCDQWFVVAEHEKVVVPDELPEPWGLYVPMAERTKLRLVKPCVPFPDRDKSIMRRSFAAAMLRKIGETMVPRKELDGLVAEAVEAALARTREGGEVKRLEERCQAMGKVIQTFRTVTGVDLEGWRGTENICRAVDAVLRTGRERQTLVYAKENLERAAKTIADALESWPTKEAM